MFTAYSAQLGTRGFRVPYALRPGWTPDKGRIASSIWAPSYIVFTTPE
jgi:hypothetical protein